MTRLTKATFRILDILSRGSTSAMSINDLSKEIASEYGSNNYSYINKQLHSLKKENLINLIKIGRAQVAILNFKNYQLFDLFTQMEIYKKNLLIKQNNQLERIIFGLEKRSMKFHYVHSVSMIRPKQNINLNRMELLVIFRTEEIDGIWNISYEKEMQYEKVKMLRLLQSEANKNNIRVDFLFLDKKEFIRLLQANEVNQVKEMMANKIIIFNPRQFWIDMSDIQQMGMLMIETNIRGKETNPIDIREEDMIYNLARFGYREFGTSVNKGIDYSIEYVVVAILLKGDARRVEAIPVLILKNMIAINSEVLVFLCKKYQVMDKLLSLFSTDKEMKYSIEEKMRLYDVYSN